ncbi:hypothetical protein ACFXGA_06180 [Actinosynnema sp. NPDC059335]|uniref:hypothetical protein n=1 Tax=Actinosynnema sp. NPDC059335 TaxID=3346804 RepID=UPI00366BA68A
MTIGSTEKTWRSREDYLAEMEEQRRELVRKARLYYEGKQYDEDNERCMQEWLGALSQGEKSLVRRLFDKYQLPEHLRRHAYSTQIAECVDWIADRLAEGFAVEATPAAVQTIITDCLNSTPALSAKDESEQRNVAPVLRNAGRDGDVPVRVRWEAAEGTCWLEFWPGDQVRMDFPDGRPDRVERVVVEQIDWRPDERGDEEQVTLRREWLISDQDEGNGSPQSAAKRRRCVERVYVIRQDDTEPPEQATPEVVHETGTDRIPWQVVRIDRPDLQAPRGISLITEQAMNTATRYDAVQGRAWLNARYNSHGNLAVVGDAAMVNKQEKVHKDVADVMTFPGGTAVTAITLPTDPSMINQQTEELKNALYGKFGLVRTDQETVQGLGAVSGYALEILNEKSEGTFARVRSQLITDLTALFNLVVDCHLAWSSGVEPTTEFDDADDDLDQDDDRVADDTADPHTDRKIIVRLGSGWVVDIAQARDDHLAGLISRREYLRIRGRSKTEIDAIEDEIAAEEAEKARRERATTGENGRFGQIGSTQAGRTVNDARRDREPAAVGGRS